jgi:DNA-binding XRE family transcriptional regulator
MATVLNSGKFAMADQTTGTTSEAQARAPGAGARAAIAGRNVANQSPGEQAIDEAGSRGNAIDDEAARLFRAANDAAATTGADYMNSLANAMRRAAGEFDRDLPVAGSYIREAASRMDGLADTIRAGNFEAWIKDAQSFASRQQPAIFGIALVAGFGLMQLLRGTAELPTRRRPPQTGEGRIRVEASNEPRNIGPAKVTSKGRGRPLADLVRKMERRTPELASARGLSSAAMRAGDLVRAMRKEAGLSQSQLAKRLEVTQARISEIEAGIGAQGPTWDLMERLSAACGRTLGVAGDQSQAVARISAARQVHLTGSSEAE